MTRLFAQNVEEFKHFSILNFTRGSFLRSKLQSPVIKEDLISFQILHSSSNLGAGVRFLCLITRHCAKLIRLRLKSGR
jgi:hypothetical protein